MNASSSFVSFKKGPAFFKKRLLCLLATACLVGISHAADYQVTSFEMVSSNNNGDTRNRVDILFIGDGYDVSEQGKFRADVASMQSAITNPTHDPFLQAYQNYFNIHVIDVVSATSTWGAVDTTAYNAANSPLGSRFDGSGGMLQTGAGSTVTSGILQSTVSGVNLMDKWYSFNYPEQYKRSLLEVTVVLANTPLYGNSGGSTRVSESISPRITMAANAYNNGTTSKDMFLHEMGHAFADLADEYGSGTYAGAEPAAVNLTKDAAGTKWERWKGTDLTGTGPIGAYTGSGGAAGVYRPSANSKMMSLDRPFDAVSREQFILSIYQKVRPLDGFTYDDHLQVKKGTQNPDYSWTGRVTVDDILFSGNDISIADTLVLGLGENIEVNPISDLILVDWYVDEIRIAAAKGETTFNPLLYGYAEGNYKISAYCRDGYAYEYDLVRIPIEQTLLGQTVVWENVIVIPEPSTYACLFAIAGGVAGVALVRRRKK